MKRRRRKLHERIVAVPLIGVILDPGACKREQRALHVNLAASSLLAARNLPLSSSLSVASP